MRYLINLLLSVGLVVGVAQGKDQAQDQNLDGLIFLGPYSEPMFDGVLKPVDVDKALMILAQAATKDPKHPTDTDITETTLLSNLPSTSPTEVPSTPAPGIHIVCAQAPAIIDKRLLPKGMFRWSCAITNETASTRTITEAMMLSALLQSGVGILTSVETEKHSHEKLRLGFWTRTVHWLSKGGQPLVYGISSRAIKISDAEAPWVTGLAFGIPLVVDLLTERAKSEVDIPVWTEPVDLAPGSIVIRSAFSGEYSGPVPVSATIP